MSLDDVQTGERAKPRPNYIVRPGDEGVQFYSKKAHVSRTERMQLTDPRRVMNHLSISET